ncbi:FkbM family methyltransferase [Mangrovicoccus sp. HB161399]|uniref:FkbM family methyltransferase n=1 Tax=Mangrovicoccus sp. HB161399 TaxID=2720392 RepID=UPI00155788EA|nr:FkbM family methyltransferase [Mangrovicoccus sp. HB161399]
METGGDTGTGTARATPRVDRAAARREGMVPKVTMRSMLSGLGMAPDAVLDIGVARGTPQLYDAFPDAAFLLVDPRPGFAERLAFRPERFAALTAAVGAEAGRMRLEDRGGHSSLNRRIDRGDAPPVASYDVDVVTLDGMIASLGLAPEATVGIKLDTEGHELDAIRGLTRDLERIAFIACEVSVLDRFVGGYTFAELVALLDQKGFRFYAVMSTPRPRRPLRFLDCLFLRHDDPRFA